MSGSIELDIDQLSLSDYEGEPSRVRPLLEKALTLCAERLQKSPLARFPAKRLALAELELGSFSAQDLLGPSGAERLADALYASLGRHLG